MFKINRKPKESKPVEETKQTILTALNATIPTDATKAKTLAETYKLVSDADQPAPKAGMSDQVLVSLVGAGASLLGILAVIKHEDVNVIATKALGFIAKPKI